VSCIAAAGELSSQEITDAELHQRRVRILEAAPDGIVLLHARPEPKAMEQWGFVQDPSFLYFSGLGDLPGAILALDGPRGEVHLFVPPPPMSFGLPVEGLVPEPGPAAAVEHGMDSVRSWDEFESWVEARLSDGVQALYVDEPRRAESSGVPPGLARVAGHLALWRTALEQRFPTVEVRSAKGLILTLRSRKSPAEVAILHQNASATAKALLAAARAIHPGATQREAEGAVVSTCLAEGAQGPSFWPWTMAGPNAHVNRLVSAFYRYDQLNRVMEAGELVRVDIGCAGGLYGADVGRTLPVSGRFSDGQREAWDLLIEGYLAGLNAMAPGVTVRAVRTASRAAVEAAAEGLVTEMGRRAAEVILAGGDGVWHMHGVGIESGEDALPVLEEGTVIAYEPGFRVGTDAFYLEDMIAITDSGFAVLSEGVPYRAAEIEAAMARGR
jgi:Xaa-Pro aminopeptidase